MLRFLIFTTALISFSTGSFAAKKIEFGKLTQEEINMKYYPPDSSAQAVVLFDVGQDVIEISDLSVRTVRKKHTRIKIFGKGGIRWADQKIMHYKSEFIRSFKGATYNLDASGNVTKDFISKENIFNEKIVDELQYRTFSFPKVKEGSIIEFTYEITLVDGFKHFYNWQFQKPIPVIYSEYNFVYPTVSRHGMLNFNKNMKGYIESEIITNGIGDNKYIMRDIPAFNDVPYLSASENYAAKVEFVFSSIGFPATWENVLKALNENENFNKGMSRNYDIKTIIKTLCENKKSKEEKARAIYNYLKNNFNWNSEYGVLMTQSQKKTFDTKRGNISDINLLLVNLLQLAELKAEPVIGSTREHGFINPHVTPIIYNFNNVICKLTLDSCEVLLDATDKFLPFGYLHKECINGQYLVVGQKPSWTSTHLQNKYQEKIYASLSVDENGTFGGTIQEKKYGYAAVEARTLAANDKKENSLLKTREEALPDYEISNFSITNKDSLESHLGINYTLISNVKNNEIISINPLLLFGENENKFQRDERVYPINFNYPREIVYNGAIKIADNYKIEKLPQAMNMVLPDKSAKLLYNVGVNGNIVQISYRLITEKIEYPATDYLQLKELFTAAVQKNSESIILKKVKK